MDKETIARLVLGEIEKLKKNDGRYSGVDSAMNSACSLAPALLLYEASGDLSNELEGKLKAANFNPVTDLSFAGDAKMLVLTDLGHKNLSYICDGVDEGDYASAVINAILEGKDIFVIEEGIRYRKFRKSSNKNFYEMMNKKERLLSTFGVKIMKEQCFISYLKKNFSPQSTAEEKDLFSGKLMTEDHAKRLREGGTLEINMREGVIITPLAKDYIRENNMSVRYRGH